MKRREYPIKIEVNGRKVTKVVIDPHYEIKHSHYLNDKMILELVKLLKYAQKNGYKDVEMAEKLGITKADMSRIFNHRIDKFSTDKLVNLYAKIKPDYKIKVS